jgi:hypothetical protein
VSAPPPPSELRARIGAQVRASRQAQGLSPHVTDAATLDGLASWVELAQDGPDHGNPDHPHRATVGLQGKEQGRAGTASNGAAVMTPSPELAFGMP